MRLACVAASVTSMASSSLGGVELAKLSNSPERDSHTVMGLFVVAA